MTEITETKNIIVTGANKGLGFGIVQELAKNCHNNIIMACRNVDKGNHAKSQILSKHKDAQIWVQKLDIADSKSIDQFISRMKQKSPQIDVISDSKNVSEFISKMKSNSFKIDVLMNNAGVAGKKDQWGMDVFDYTFKTNFYGTIELTQKMLPLLNDKAKIVTMGSCSGRNAFKNMKSEQLRKRFSSSTLSKQELFQLINQFKAAVKDNTFEEKGWPKSIYGMSKLGINLYCSILGKDKEIIDRGIQVYSCCPGYVKTDMTGNKGDLTVEEGVKTAVYLIQRPFQVNKKVQGGFFQKQQLSSTFEQVV